MKNRRISKALMVVGLAGLALLTMSVAADAQGVLFVKTNNVGIGTANPEVPLHIDTPGGDDFAGMGPAPLAAGGQGFNFGYAASVAGGFFNTRSGGLTNMNIMTSNSVRMLISGTTGNIAIGASVLGVNPTHPLQHTSGAHLTAGGVWTSVSSRAAKEDITELSTGEALEAFRELNPVTFRYKAEPGEAYVGFIAEDVPELVATSDRKALATMDVVAVLTKVVQEQQSTIEELSQRLEQLESN